MVMMPPHLVAQGYGGGQPTMVVGGYSGQPMVMQQGFVDGQHGYAAGSGQPVMVMVPQQQQQHGYGGQTMMVGQPAYGPQPGMLSHQQGYSSAYPVPPPQQPQAGGGYPMGKSL